MPTKFVYIVEESIVDVNAKTLTTHTRNIGLKTFAHVEERVIYKPDVTNINWTMTEKMINVDSTFYGLATAAKHFCLEFYKNSIKNTYKGFNHTLEQLYGKGCEAKNNTKNKFNVKLKNIKESANIASEFAKSKVPRVVAADKTQ